MPVVLDNESGWGPAADSCPDHLKHLPFAPFSKNDRLGRACEWSQTRERDSESPFPLVFRIYLVTWRSVYFSLKETLCYVVASRMYPEVYFNGLLERLTSYIDFYCLPDIL
jgi:hypothetical protein